MPDTRDAGALPAVVLAPAPARYRRMAWLAVGSLVGFLAAYLGLAAWFALTAWRLGRATLAGSPDAFWTGLVAACAALLAVFMLKALFFRQRRDDPDTVPLSPAEQPEFFAELHAIADAIGAPRPHRVFASARVNAAVFYDLSPLNLLWPSRKSLEIGLGLVNVLNRSELRAVLAHEFGHFAQRAMAVGRWVYVAQQIAARLVAQRGKLDDFLRGLSRFDIRLAWIGWGLSLIVWAIRSIVDSAFTGVQLLQRSLGREMEYGADAVAVALTGSDALVDALYKLQTADADWERAAALATELRDKERWVGDLFTLQTAWARRVGEMLADADYGRVPPLADPALAAGRRLFDAADSQVPQMWRTHPLNHEREARAKQRYAAGRVDERSAWTLFAGAAALREQVTRRLLKTPEQAQPMDEATVLAAVDERFTGEHLQPRYLGVYLGRTLTRHADAADQLADTPQLGLPDGIQRLAALYPQSLGEAVRRWRRLDAERDAAELADLAGQLRRHDREAREVHLALARGLGDGSEARLRGLLQQLHYAEHTAANLRDLRLQLAHTVHVLTAGRVGDRERQRVLTASAALYNALHGFYGQAGAVVLDAPTLARLKVDSWQAALGTLVLEAPNLGQLGNWLGVIDSWMNAAENALGALRGAVLAELLACEAAVARQARQGGAGEPAEPAENGPLPGVPAAYATLREGAERPRDLKLSLWARFIGARGRLAAAARLAVAGGIVAGVLGFGGGAGDIAVQVYNGFDRPLRVSLGSARSVTVPAFGSAEIAHGPAPRLSVQAETESGELVERFDTALEHGPGHPVYNIAGLAPLMELTYVYGPGQEAPPRSLGAPRWSVSSAHVLFGDPPRSVKVSHGGSETRRVLYGAADALPGLQFTLLGDQPAERERLAALHLRWDNPHGPLHDQWLAQLRGQPAHDRLLAEALQRTPRRIDLMRERFDTLPDAERRPLCDGLAGQAAAPGADGDAVYLAARCLPDGAQRNAALRAGFARFPQHPWLAYGMGWVEAGEAHWREALAAYDLARTEPALAPIAAITANRIRRLIGVLPKGVEQMGPPSRLQAALGLEEAVGGLLPDVPAYQRLATGGPAAAVNLRDGRRPTARLLRLAAASDGASAELRERAAALRPDEGLDRDTLWTALALAERDGRRTEPLLAAARSGGGEEFAKVEAFRAALRNPATRAAAEAHLKGLPPDLRGQAYAMATVLLGERTPPDWREAAKRLLDSTERPHFR